MKITDYLGIILEKQQNFGVKEALRIAWSGLLNLGARRLILYALSTPKAIPKAVEAAKNHTFKFASLEELMFFSQDPDNRIGQVDIDRVKNGHVQCLLQLDGEFLAGFAWVWRSKLAYISDGFHLNLPDDTIYNYKGFTHPKYRGYGFQAMRHVQLLSLLENEGITRLFGFVDHFNSRSLRGVKKSGYEKVGELKIRHKKNGKVKSNLTLDELFWAGVPRL